mgnify:CR=1 FL=1
MSELQVYVFDINCCRCKDEWTSVYRGDGSAKRVAKRMFKRRSDNPNDELWVHRNRIDGPCVGKVAYDPSGSLVRWFDAADCAQLCD